jgi:hypothetical protein
MRHVLYPSLREIDWIYETKINVNVNSTKTADSRHQSRNCNAIGGHRSAIPNVLPPIFHSQETVRQFNLCLFTFPKSKHRVTPEDMEQVRNICAITVLLEMLIRL